MTDALLDLLTVGVLGFVGYRIARGADIAIRQRRHDVVRIVTGIRLRHVLWAIPTLAAVVTAAVALTSVPGLSWGWWTAIGGTGNPVSGQTERTTGTTLEWLIPLGFVLVLLPALPLFAEREEEMFRLGAETRTFWGRRLADLKFGLIHAIIGIPIGVALALSVGGAAFTAHYLRGEVEGGPAEGLDESTRAHTAYNGVIIIGILLPLLIAEAIGL